MKIARPAQEAQPGEDQPVTQRRTLSIKHQEEVPASERSVKMAEDEAALKGRGGRRRPAGERGPERAVWAWCLVSLAAMVIIGLVIWVFCVQLLPKDERFSWPGRILSFNDPFFKDERGWL
jgi:hypothetical protein